MDATNGLRRLLPFLAWFPATRETLRADLLAGVSVGLVLVPQALAYAQLAGLPPYYGLYAAFLPVLIGALWGCSRQLATGPVAMVSLLTGAALSQFAAPGSEQFIALAILLALMVGAMELAMGLAGLGAIVNFVSHPVIVGFTNAAALIIAFSQLDKVLGVASVHGVSFAAGVWDVLQQAGSAHPPTLLMAAAALAIIAGMRRFAPRWPAVLIAVVLTTALSWAIGFENKLLAQPAQFADATARAVVDSVLATARTVKQLGAGIAEKTIALKKLEKSLESGHPQLLALEYDIQALRFELKAAEREHRLRARELRHFVLRRAPGAEGAADRFYLEGLVPPGVRTDGQRWRFTRIAGGELVLSGGGEVVGAIPPGLPKLALPHVSWDEVMLLLSSAFVIALVGFMEALSIARAMAVKTRQRIDPDQELIGQGLANLAGSLTQSFPVSGSFSRSAVNLEAGAVTGLSSVFTWLVVLATLLFLTPLLYHLPQATLAAIIIMAVANLINVKAMVHAWKAHRHDGMAAAVTFAATLAFAPHLDAGILIGAGLAIVLYLYRSMRPRVAVLGRHADGTLRDARLYDLPTSEHVIAVRFDGSLYFANVPYFENALLEQAARHPKAQYILVVGDGINELDASGEEAIRNTVRRLKERGVTVVFSGLKRQILDVMERTGLYALIGAQNIFRTEDAALEAILGWIADPGFDPASCPLRPGNRPAAAAPPPALAEKAQQPRTP
ncbi:MAG TPA: SulP family inorganic anion transporter [Burkholderiales bacterium]|nr:SulP family inorganic anion transporter [Burkholderiales bacterium]